MEHHSVLPMTHDWDAPDQFNTIDTFQARTKLWLAGERVNPTL